MDYEPLLNRTIEAVKPSGIRRFFDIASEMKDIISLSIGEPDFSTPWHVREAGINTLRKGNTWYSPNRGFSELRQEISRYYNRRFHLEYDWEKEILVTVGGSEALDLCLRTVLNSGEEVIIPQPSFVCYQPLTEMAGGTPVILTTCAEDNFKLTPQALKEKITPKTKLLILPYPTNPTGGVMRQDDLEAIAEVLRGTDILILADEIYGELTYGGKDHVSIASLSGMRERTVIASGFSKSCAMTGWRLGYAMGPQLILSVMTKLHQYSIMCAPTTAQYAAVEALKNGDKDIAYMRGEYDMRRRFVVEEFNRMGLNCFTPEGAFYAFPCIRSTGMTSEEFCTELIYSQKVAVVPGTAFGDSGEGFVRVSYASSMKNIKEALSRIEKFISNHNI